MANINIYGKLYNNTVDKIIAGAEQIWDTTQSKMQDIINAELYAGITDFEDQLGQPNGIATLGGDGKIPSSQLPSYVDDVLEYDNKSAFPQTGEAGKIYVAKDTNLTYRWSGSDYIEISQSLALGETSSTAYAGDKGKANRDAISSLPSTLISEVSLGTRDANQIILNINKATKSGLNYGSPAAANVTLTTASTSMAGLMSAADKGKLDDLMSSSELEDKFNEYLPLAGGTLSGDLFRVTSGDVKRSKMTNLEISVYDSINSTCKAMLSCTSNYGVVEVGNSTNSKNTHMDANTGITFIGDNMGIKTSSGGNTTTFWNTSGTTTVMEALTEEEIEDICV